MKLIDFMEFAIKVAVPVGFLVGFAMAFMIIDFMNAQMGVVCMVPVQ